MVMHSAAVGRRTGATAQTMSGGKALCPAPGTLIANGYRCGDILAMACAIYAFDAYGTLFDVHAAVRRHAAALGPEAAEFSALWRAKQLEYSWVRTLAGRYR